LEGLDWSTIFGGVDFKPERFAIGVQTGLVGIDPLPAFLLSVSLLSAENTCHLVSVRVVAWIVVPPLLLILIVTVVVLWPDVLAILLASILLILGKKLFLAVLGRHCLLPPLVGQPGYVVCLWPHPWNGAQL
jgi:hypothetical protein